MCCLYIWMALELSGRCQKQRSIDFWEDLQFAGAFVHMVQEMPRHGRLEGCHRMAAATHPDLRIGRHVNE